MVSLKLIFLISFCFSTDQIECQIEISIGAGIHPINAIKNNNPEPLGSIWCNGVNSVELMNKYPDFVVLMHLKDMAHGVKGNNTGKEDVDKNVILGMGILILQVL